jgi:hypothetical protein
MLTDDQKATILSEDMTASHELEDGAILAFGQSGRSWIIDRWGHPTAA